MHMLVVVAALAFAAVTPFLSAPPPASNSELIDTIAEPAVDAGEEPRD